MKYSLFIIGASILILFATQTYSLQKEQNASIFYDECRIILSDSQIEKYPDLQDNLCLRINTTGNTSFLFTKYQNASNLPLLTEDELTYLKNNYYRGEELGVYFKTQSQKLLPDLGYIVDSSYELVFLGDTALEQYKSLEKECIFTSYKPTCKDTKIQDLVSQIEEQYSDKVFLDFSNILSLSSAELSKNIEKNKIVEEKMQEIETEDNSQYALFAKQYILYKLAIHTSILSNRVADLELIEKYGPLKLGEYVKNYASGIQLRQDENYSYFYLGNNRVNTIKNDDEHFDEGEKESLTDTNLRDKISQKYTSYSLQDFEEQFLVIEKSFSDSSTYIIIDKINFYRYPIAGPITESQVGKSGLYILSKTSDEDSILLLSNKEISRLISTQKEITGFELLVGEVEVTFSDDKTETIDI